jgi:hypothetical protein
VEDVEFWENELYGPKTGRRRLLTFATALLTGAVLGCAPDRPDPSAPSDGDMAYLVVEQTPEQQRRSLDSLRLLDDHPLLIMTHHGPAPRLAGVTPRPGSAASGRPVPATTAGYACTVFVASGDASHPTVGRNFDWDHHAALVLLADPPDGYASVSIVDISYLGYDLSEAAALVAPDADPERRRNLLRAVALPFDGMNEHGLVVGMASLNGARPDIRPDRPTVGSIGIMRLLLDQARTVPEAVAILQRYNIDFTGGPPLHYFVADAAGDSAVIEFVDGTTRVLPREKSWQLMVNFQLADATAEERAADWRYRTGSSRLEAAHGRLDWQESLALLRDLRQGHTQWSAVYEPRTGAVHVTTGQRYDRVHHLRVPGR